MKYEKAVDIAAKRLVEAGKTQPIYQAMVVLIAGIIADMFDRPTRGVINDLKAKKRIIAQTETKESLKPDENRLKRDFREWTE